MILHLLNSDFAMKHNTRAEKLSCIPGEQTDPEGSTLISELTNSWALLTARTGPYRILPGEFRQGPLYGKEFCKALSHTFQSLFIVFQGNASRVHPDSGLGLVPMLGSGLARTATGIHPMSVTRGLAVTYTEHRVITANKNISP